MSARLGIGFARCRDRDTHRRMILRLVLSVCLVVFTGCSGSSGAGDGGHADGGVDAGGSLKCGNGTLETDEACEGFELRGHTCVSEGFTLGQLRCSSACVLDTSACSKCGDGKISGAEKCDSSALTTGVAVFAGKTCASEVDAGATGNLDCADSCNRISTAGCQFPPALPRRNEPCSLQAGCAMPFVCDVVSTGPLEFRCRLHCDAAGIGSAQGCPAGELCADGGIEPEGATASPPAYVSCPAGNSTGCATGFSCLDAGMPSSFCGKRVGACR